MPSSTDMIPTLLRVKHTESVVTDNKATLAFAIPLCSVGEVLFRSATHFSLQET
jgi:hypothetical protein